MPDLASVLGGSSRRPPAGIFLGTVTRTEPTLDGAGVYVLVPRMFGGLEIGPCPAAAVAYAPGDIVAVGPLEEAGGDELVVLGRIGPPPSGGGTAGPHDHDDRYYTETEVNNLLASYATDAEVSALLTNYALTTHDHDTRYYTETEVDTLLGGYVPTSRAVNGGSGLNGGGTLTQNRTLSVDFAPDGAGTAAQAVAGTDSRLSNPRTPTAHAATHAAAGSDPVTLTVAQLQATGTRDATTFLRGDGTWATPAGGTPTAHAASHASGGSDPVTPAAIGAVPTSRSVFTSGGLQGGGALSADRTLSIAYAADGVADTTRPPRGDDSRLSNARTPTAHTHPASDLTATGTRDNTTFLRGDNTWATPPGGGSSELTIICTSSTRPAHVAGRNIYETDTERFYTSDGSAWILRAVKDCYGEVRATINQSLANNTNVAVAFDVNYRSTHTGFADQAGDRLVIPIAGDYRFGAVAHFASPAAAPGANTAFRRVIIQRNGSYVGGDTGGASTVNGTALTPSSPDALPCVAGDIITLEAYQNSGGALNLSTPGFVGTSLWARRIA